jgi:hypothetical protein
VSLEPGDPLIASALEIYRMFLGREFAPLSGVTVESINGAAAASSPFAKDLRQAGFASDYRGMSLWKR